MKAARSPRRSAYAGDAKKKKILRIFDALIDQMNRRVIN